ncbi:MAG: hypothetical protein JJD92_13595 [Frankiaceae bacterium]|nr:hypothetical protein [Frankiaceae bacterium]
MSRLADLLQERSRRNALQAAVQLRRRRAEAAEAAEAARAAQVAARSQFLDVARVHFEPVRHASPPDTIPAYSE